MPRSLRTRGRRGVVAVLPGHVSADKSDQNAPADHGSDAGGKYCPGCGARPLIARSAPLNLAFDASPIFVPALVPATFYTAEPSFAVFHLPRA